MAYEWRIVRNRRLIGKRFILQKGYYTEGHSAYSKGVNRLFAVQYEEFYDTRARAEEAKREFERMQPSTSQGV